MWNDQPMMAHKQGMYDLLPPAVIFDLDGTLADQSHRRHLAEMKKWDDYFSQVKYDLPITDVINLYGILRVVNPFFKFIICSGRSDQCKADTIEWLQKYGIKYDHLFMRKETDHRPDFKVKDEIFRNEIKGKFDVFAVFDDRDQVVHMWRRHGLRCYQVAPGNF